MFYAYELVVTPDEKVCYVGKGKGRRAYEHRRRAFLRPTTGYPRHLWTKLRQLLIDGKDFYPRIIFETSEEDVAFKVESETINKYGLSNLFNIASHAFLGRTLKPESKQRVSDRVRSAWRDGLYANRSKRRNFGRKPMPNGWFPKTRDGIVYRGISKWSHKHHPGKTDRWRACITVNGRSKLICTSTDLNVALKAYDDMAQKLHGVRPNGTQP